MAMHLLYATVRETPRQVIHVVRVRDEMLEAAEIDDLAERMREHLSARGDVVADVVLVQGERKETLRLYGNSYAVARVRTAMFNASLNWSPIRL
jgi:translation initiation factor 1 (eIF-1/SUI1)